MSRRDSRLSAALNVACVFLLATPLIARADVRGLVPSIATASVVASDNPPSPTCRSLECVRRHLSLSATVRLEGEFGRFAGRVTCWDADSLSAFEVDPDWGGSAPVSPIGWSQIARVDKR